MRIDYRKYEYFTRPASYISLLWYYDFTTRTRVTIAYKFWFKVTITRHIKKKEIKSVSLNVWKEEEKNWPTIVRQSFLFQLLFGSRYDEECITRMKGKKKKARNYPTKKMKKRQFLFYLGILTVRVSAQLRTVILRALSKRVFSSWCFKNQTTNKLKT